MSCSSGDGSRQFTGCWTTPNSPRLQGCRLGATRPRRLMRSGPPTYDDPDNGLFAMDEPIIDEILDGLPVGDALDAACGTGRLAARLADRGFRVTGVDGSAEMLEVARTRLPGARFSEGDLGSLPLPDGAVDPVTTALALTHVPDLRPVYAEFARVLRPGGSLVVSDVHPDLVLLGSTVKATAPDGGHGWRRLIGTASAITCAPLSPCISRSCAVRNTHDLHRRRRPRCPSPPARSANGRSGHGRCWAGTLRPPAAPGTTRRSRFGTSNCVAARDRAAEPRRPWKNRLDVLDLDDHAGRPELLHGPLLDRRCCCSRDCRRARANRFLLWTPDFVGWLWMPGHSGGCRALSGTIRSPSPRCRARSSEPAKPRRSGTELPPGSWRVPHAASRSRRAVSCSY